MASRTFRHPLQLYELYEQLYWFGKLRWLASAGLVLASVAGGLFGVPQVWPNLCYVAAAVAAYNLLFHFALRPRPEEEVHYHRLHAYCIFQVGLDIAVLLVMAYIIGGSVNPVLPFFVFHMAIGTSMLATRTMYAIATAAWLGALALYASDVLNILTPGSGDLLIAVRSPARELSLAVLAALVFGTVYLTDTVKKRSENYKRIADFVREEGRFKLELAMKEIRDLESRKSHYMRISAHQLRSPLGTIKTSLQVLDQAYVDPRSERGAGLIRGALRRVDDLLAIVNDLLELAKIREGKDKAPWTRDVDVTGILDEVLESSEPFAEARGVRLVPEIKGNGVLQWGVVPDLRFALDNLVQNAIKYSHTGGEVRVEVRATEEQLIVSVADQGIGIPEELQSDVFLEFIRAPNAKRHASQGTGLGLAIVKAAIDQHGGSIVLTSEEGAGSTFTVTLPLRWNAPLDVSAAPPRSADRISHPRRD